jgi:DNA-binding transcriptional regulator YiaG
MTRTYKSEILRVIHEEATANFEVGVIDEERMRYYDAKCLAPAASMANRPPVGIPPVSVYAARH